MARLSFSQEDLNRSKLVPPGKYPVLIKEYEQQQAGTDGSDLYVYQLQIAEGEFKGVLLRYQISEKAPGMAISFCEALGMEVKAGTNFDPASAKGKHVIARVQRGDYKNRATNEVVDFSPLEQPPTAQAPARG